MAAESLNTRSSKLHVISAVATHSFLAHTTTPVNEGWNLDDEINEINDDEINVQAAIIFSL